MYYLIAAPKDCQAIGWLKDSEDVLPDVEEQTSGKNRPPEDLLGATPPHPPLDGGPTVPVDRGGGVAALGPADGTTDEHVARRRRVLAVVILHDLLQSVGIRRSNAEAAG